MRFNFDAKKGTEKVSGLLQKTADASKKTAVAVQQGAQTLAEKSKNDSYLRKLKKYNPVFPEQYCSDNFNIPNMIRIVDDAERRGIDVCEGSIGWLSKEGNIEVLNLYDEVAETCEIQFVPFAKCNEIYYVDNFDRHRFVRVDCIFSKAHEERMAELEHIAYSLGAKRCTIEIIESEVETKVESKKFEIKEKLKINIGTVSSTEKSEKDVSIRESHLRDGKTELLFDGCDMPQSPELKWFKYDDGVRNLIQMRCQNINSVKSKELKLNGSSSAAMSQKTAKEIENAVGKMGGGGSLGIESQAIKENHSKLVFYVEF